MTGPLSAARVSLLRNVGGPRLSPDGSHVLWLESYAGRSDVVVAPVGDWDDQLAWTVTSDPTVASNVAHGGGSVCWSPDGSDIAYVSRGDLFRVPAEGGEPEAVLTGFGVAAPVWGTDVIAFCRSVADPAGVGVVGASGGDWPFRLSGRADFCFDPDITTSANPAVAWHEWDVPAMPWDGGRIVVRAVEAGAVARVVDGGEDVSVGEPRFAPGATATSGQLAYLCDRGGMRTVWVADLGDGSVRRLGADDAEVGPPAWGPGMASHAWSPDGTQIVYAAGRLGATELRVVDATTGKWHRMHKSVGTYSHLSWVGGRIAALYSDVVTPPEVCVFEPAGSWRPTRRGLAAVPDVQARHLSWCGDDGAEVYGILVGPVGDKSVSDGPRPLIVWPHGGPTDQSRLAFNPRVAWLVSRGYAVLFVNHRGSTGYGREYTQALNGRWGELDADDVAAGVRHLVGTGDAAAGGVAIMGGSAGGYVVLSALIRHPDLFTCGIDLYGVADLERLAATTWRFEAHYSDSLIGPLPEAVATYRERSPLHHADRIRAPLLILHGEDDEVVPVDQSAAIAAAVRANGIEAEFHTYPGEGHGWSKPETVTDELGRIEAFLKRHLPGS